MTWRRGGCAGITGLLASSFRETLAGWPFTLSPVSGRLAACPCLLVACRPAGWKTQGRRPPPPPPFHGLVFPFAKCQQSLSAASGGSPSSQKETERNSPSSYTLSSVTIPVAEGKGGTFWGAGEFLVGGPWPLSP